MSLAAETFTVMLARVSGKSSRYLRGLQKADRDDVRQMALVWCWEHMTDYDPSVPLERWFASAVRHARRAFERGESRQAGELLDDAPTIDDTSRRAEAQDAAKHIIEQLGPENHKLALLRAEGLTAHQIAARLGVSVRTVRYRLKGFKQLRHLLPEPRDIQTVIRAAAVDYDATPADAPIDREIERLEFAPPLGGDCPPCWRCKWFEGWTPGSNYRPHKHKIADADVQSAVSNIEARKIIIAERVSAGTLKG